MLPEAADVVAGHPAGMGGAVGSDYEYVRQVMQSPGIRKVISEVADRKAKLAGVIAVSEGEAGIPIVRGNGTRPKGRPYARISIPAANEHGDSKTRRLRLLARVVTGR